MAPSHPFPTVDVPDHAHYTIGVVILVVGITGILGNFLVIYAFCRSRSLRTPSNIFIINLAITDFFMCLTQTPTFFIASMHKRWIFGKKGCELYAFCGALFGICSMMTLMVIAVDRYVVITKPLASLGAMSRRKALSIVAAAWLYSMGWSLPPFFGWSAYIPEGLMTSCSWDYMTFTPLVRSYTMLLFTFVFFIPLSIIIFCYCCIFRAIRHTTRAFEKLHCGGTRDSVKRFHRMKSEWKMAKIALIVILLFVVSWAPYSCMALTAFAGYADLLTPYMSSVPAVIAKASAIHNPIIYAITHPKYRSAISRYVPYLGTLLCIRGRDRFSSSSSSFQSTRRSTVTSQLESHRHCMPARSSQSDSELARFANMDEDSSYQTPVNHQLSSDIKHGRRSSQRLKIANEPEDISMSDLSIQPKNPNHLPVSTEKGACPVCVYVCVYLCVYACHRIPPTGAPPHPFSSPGVCPRERQGSTVTPQGLTEEQAARGVGYTSAAEGYQGKHGLHRPDMSTYTVMLNGPAPWGFRLQGGKDFNMPLTISRITPGSKASGGSLSQGDIISAIDGASTDGMTHLEAQNKIKAATARLSLTMQKSRRPAPVPTATPRMDSPMPVIPHQKVIANTAANLEYTPSFNPIALKDSALSTHKPIEVRGPGGKATIVHAQYNTPISMYSQDAIMDAIAGQSQAKGHDGEEAGSPLAGVLPIKDPVVDCASPVYQAVIRPGDNTQDLSEWARRAANLQSKSFRMLAHITGTEYMQDPDEEALQRSREKFESEMRGPRFAKLKNWHHGLSAQILNVQE
nr:uncharacterized protein LOC131110066 isoform X5 [Doryrhamphus excisus]